MFENSLSRVVWLALVVVISVLLTSCKSIAFFAANLPATFASYTAQRDIKYGSLDHQRLDAYRPTDYKQLRPVVVFVHGGGWTSGSKDEYRFVAAALTSRGVVAVLPNYRLYPQVKFPAFVDDVAQAVLWTHVHAAEYGGDPNRIYLMGHSAGAQITALVAFDAKYLAHAGGDQSWIKGFIGLAGPYDFLPFKEEYLRDIFGPESQYPQSQPVNYVDDHAPPALLIHGEADHTVWPSNSKSLTAKLRLRNVQVVERYYPAMDHSDVIAALSVYYRGRRSVLKDIEDFIYVNAEPASPSVTRSGK